MPPREQNLLLLAAGHAPVFNETPLDDLEHIAGVLDFILDAHEPNIAIVVDRRWDLIRANRAATVFTSTLIPEPPNRAAPTFNVMRLNFHPEGMRRRMVGWESAAAALLRRLERDVASTRTTGACEISSTRSAATRRWSSFRNGYPTPGR